MSRFEFFVAVTGALLWLGTASPIAAGDACQACDADDNCVVVGEGYLMCSDSGGFCDVAHGNCSSGIGGGGCFVAGTQIMVPGGAVSLEELSEGDQVMAYFEGGVLKPARVTRAYHVVAEKYILINGRVGVTSDHPFLLDGGWVEARDLRVGDEISSSSGGTIRISSATVIEKAVRTYNIEIAGPKTFVAEGFIVHNKDPNLGEG